jgi:hypothetical protein
MRSESKDALSAVLSMEGRVVGPCWEKLKPKGPKGHMCTQVAPQTGWPVALLPLRPAAVPPQPSNCLAPPRRSQPVTDTETPLVRALLHSSRRDAPSAKSSGGVLSLDSALQTRRRPPTAPGGHQPVLSSLERADHRLPHLPKRFRRCCLTHAISRTMISPCPSSVLVPRDAPRRGARMK